MIEMESLMKYQSVFGQMYTQKQEDYYFIEQFFNDHICTWTLYTLAFGMFINICYCSYRLLLDYFLDWEPINGTTSNDILRAKQRRLVLVNTLSMQNYIYHLFWYQFIDSGAVFPTGFEKIFYLFIFMHQSHVLSCGKVLDQFLAQVIDAQISFSTTISLKKNQLFRDRVHKIVLLNFLLLVNALFSIVFCTWLLINKDEEFSWTHFNFLCYPAMVNFCELLIQRKNIFEKLTESKALLIEIHEDDKCHTYGSSMPQVWTCITYLINKDLLHKDMGELQELEHK